MKTFLHVFFFVFISIDVFGQQQSIYDLQAKTLKGKDQAFSSFKGKVLLITNIASQCGYTPQLKELQELHKKYHKKGLLVLGFPSNSFRQEPLEGAKIADFCRLNYGVDFPIFRRSDVKGENINSVFRYLVKNSPSKKEVSWNFEKFLVDREGYYFKRYSSGVKPSGEVMKKDIEKLLGGRVKKAG